MNEKCCYESCGRDVYRDANIPESNKCIFHAEKKDPQEFRKQLRDLISEWRMHEAKEWNFSKFVFPQEHKWEEVIGHDWRNEVWGDDEDYEDRALRDDPIQFPVEVDFSLSIFEGVAIFTSATFYSEAQFGFASFKNGAWFDKAFFYSSADFSGVTFMGDAKFGKAKFNQDVNFRWAHFKDVRFDSTDFHEFVSFNRSMFQGDVWFNSAEFRRDARFADSEFQGSVRFESVIISGYLDFSHLILNSVMIDNGSKMIKRVIFLFKECIFVANGLLDFRENLLDENCRVTLHTFDMSRVLLMGTDCEQIKFYNCTWGELQWRRVVGDEYVVRKLAVLNSEKPNWSRIAINYQQLAKSYRDGHDHSTANDFERGIFEMRRRTALERRGIKGWVDALMLTFYWLFSRYGGSIGWPLLWLFAGVFLISPLIYWSFSLDKIGALCFWQGVGAVEHDSLLISYFVNTRIQFSALPTQPDFWLELLITFHRVMTATLVALFLFAIRRRFKH